MFSLTGGRPGRLRELRKNAARGLVELNLEVETLRLRHEIEANVERRRLVEPLHVEKKLQPLRRWPQLGVSAGRETRRDAEHRLAEIGARQRELLDVDPQWQFRQQWLILARDGRLRRNRLAGDIHLIDVKLIDFKPALQQREPTPDDADAVDRQPDAVAVGDLEVAHGRVG